MITILSSPKPGSGTSTTAALLALTAADDRPSILVDLVGDQSHLFQMTQHARLAFVTDRLEVIDAHTQSTADTADRITALNPSNYHVIIDAGTADDPIHASLEDVAIVTWVLRPCYLTLRRAVAIGRRPDQIILLSELGRSLTASDVEHTIGAPIVANVEVHPEIARATDHGILIGEPPRRAVRALRAVIPSDEAAA
jgi:hypothetical protein